MHQIIAQGIGYLALAFVILSFQRKARLQILLTMLVGPLLFVVHYSLLQAWTGAALNLIGAAVVFVAYRKESKLWAQKKGWPYFFVALFILAGLATANTWISVLPVIAQSIGTVAVWQKNPKHIRFIMIAPRPLWLIYNVSVGSQAGVIAEIFIFLSVMTGIFRFDLRRGRKV